MKRLLILSIFVLFCLSTQAQTVPEVQQSMITKVTATWCSNCGSWGWSLYENLAEDNDDKALMLKAHPSGDLQNSLGQDLASNFNASGQPRFIVNNVDQNANSGNATSKRDAIKSTVDAAALEAPSVNAGVFVSLVNNELSIEVKTKFFQASSGDFYTNVYIVEDNVIASQSGHSSGNNTSHQDILRMAASGSSFGPSILNGSASVGQEFSQSYTVPVDANWNLGNLEFMAVVWSKSGDTYNFVNGSSTTLAISAPVVDIADEINLSIQPTLINSLSNVSISLDIQKDLSIELINLQGQTVQQIHTGNLVAGQHNFNIEKGSLASGVYLVSVQSAEGVATRRVVMQ